MALRHVVTEGDPVLRKHCREVTEVTERIRTLLGDMLETMREANGCGIAGPQVGVMRRLFVAEPAPGEVYYMINPVILDQEGEVEDDEGCLSVPGLIGTVKRPEKIRMRAMNLDGEEKEYEFEGFPARVMCHEYDHLEGILYTDKAVNVRAPEPEENEEEEAEDEA